MRCAGAPRDLGLDQGQAVGARLREQIRNERSWAERLRGWLPGSEPRRIWRDLRYYFPHHAERTLGLASGAGVGVRELLPPLAVLLEGHAGLALGAQAPGAERSLLGGSFPSPEVWTVRHSAPETGYRSVELASVSSVAAAVGVNEHGLAAMVKALPSGSASLAGCAAPAALLVQDVLQRFDTVEKAADWALRRPAGGIASLLLADATGTLGGVRIEGRERRSLEPEAGLLFALATPAERAALEKVAAETQQLDAQRLAQSLVGASGDGAAVAIADPGRRRLGIARGGELEWHPVERD